MKLRVGPILLVVLATIGVAIGLAVRPGDANAAVEAYVLFLGAVGLALLAQATSRTFAPPTESRLVAATVRPRRKENRLPELERLERELEMATQSAFDTYYRLRPTMRELAKTRLARRGIELDDPRGRAEELLGPEVWELCRPDAVRPDDHFASGVHPAAVARALDALERMA